MLEDAAGIRRVVIACGYVDLRKGIDGLSMIIGDRYHQNPFEKGTLFHKRCEIFLSTPDNPVRHSLSGDIYTIALKLLLDSVQCRGIHIFNIQNGGKQGRSNDASPEKIPGTLSP